MLLFYGLYQKSSEIVDDVHIILQCPIQTEENILSWVLGAKLASDIVPDPVRSQIEMSIDELLTNNNPDFLDTAVIDTIIDSTSVEVKINPDIFRIVFNAWLTRKTLHIKYCPLKGDKSERDIDPQILTFFNEAWYIKSYCHLKKDVRVFALHRIIEAASTDIAKSVNRFFLCLAVMYFFHLSGSSY